MERIELRVSPRDTTAKARALRRAGKLPAILYGAGGENVPVAIDAREFARLGLGSGGAHLMTLVCDDPAVGNGIALVREVQTHPVSGEPVHVDLLRVDASKPVEASVALSFVGKAAGVVEGGVLQPLRREIEIRALPDKLPDTIEVDVTHLAIHDAIHVEDLELPEGVEAVYSENFSLVTVVPPVVEKAAAEEELEAEEAEAAAAGEEGAEPAGAAEEPAEGEGASE
ncbi:MAG: 50S ribosomal protein L25 [Deltaproteobacteria bacterium]|nr:MAG: 50S ribosomal protein L25 [Deltaproteobacteria bacterium]